MRHNYIGIVCSVIFQQALGYFWYSPYLFSDAWLKAQGANIQRIDPYNPVPIVIATLAALLGAYAISIILNWTRHYDLKGGFQTGLILGALVATPTIAYHYQFLGHAWNLLLIDGFKDIIGYVVTGIILAIWPPKPKRIFT